MLDLPPLPKAALLAALHEIEHAGAAFLPWLDADGTAALLASCDQDLRYRAARPLVGGAGREVRQDFDLTMDIPARHPLRQVAQHLTTAFGEGLAAMSPNPLPGGLVFNDLIVQRYPAGSDGITPHRDHIRYVGLVALLTLAGDARFYLCDDRAGGNPRPFGMAPGGLTLMRAPGFPGEPQRPFHCVADIRRPRVSVGLRHDTRPGEPT